jgi:uracil DNA glycosylase
MMFEQLRVRVVKRGLEVWGDTGRVALVPVNTATCKTTHTHTHTSWQRFTELVTPE